MKINDGGKYLIIIDSYHRPLMVANGRNDDYLLLVNLETSMVTKTNFKDVNDLIESFPECVITRRGFI